MKTKNSITYTQLVNFQLFYNELTQEITMYHFDYNTKTQVIMTKPESLIDYCGRYYPIVIRIMETTGNFEFTTDKVLFTKDMEWQERNKFLTSIAKKVMDFRLELIVNGNNLDKDRMNEIIKKYIENK